MDTGAKGNETTGAMMGMRRFRHYSVEDRKRCLEIFDANCPASFAPNERVEYSAFLDAGPQGYEVCLVDGGLLGAFGLIPVPRPGDPHRTRISWIMIDPAAQGRGVGRAMMERVREMAAARSGGRSAEVDIAASHVSAPFFARFGAAEVARVEDGWGPGMHRVDMVLRV